MADADIIAIAEEMDDLGWSMMMDEIASSGGVNSEQIRMAAQKYLFLVERLNVELTKFKVLLRRQKELRKLNPDSFKSIGEYERNKTMVSQFLNSDIPKTLYKASFDFQELLNEFLGQKISMIFVHNGEGGPELYEMQSEEILKYDYSKTNSLTARYRANVSEFSSTMKKLQIDSQLKFNLEGLKGTYQEILYRYECARQMGKRSILWRENDKWEGLTVSAMGDINEAYAAFVLLNKVPPYFDGDIESNIRDFMLSGVAQVDNISGLLQGDVTVNNIEYGIKSADASALGLTQIKKIAQQIVSDPGFDKQKLQATKEKFRAKGRTRNKSIQMVDNTYQSLIDQLELPRG